MTCLTKNKVLSIDVELTFEKFNLIINEEISLQGITGVFGHSGSGKSTLLRAIAGLEKKINGKIIFNNIPLIDSKNNCFVKAEQRNIGLVFQDSRLFPHLSVLGNLKFAAERCKHSVLDFNEIIPYKNISNISTGHDNTLWIFNQDFQKLELFDYKSRTTRAQTVPVQSPILDLKSNYNFCWLLTENYLYVFNYFGRLIKKFKNEGYTELTICNGNIVLKKDNSLFYLKKNSDSKTT